MRAKAKTRNPRQAKSKPRERAGSGLRKGRATAKAAPRGRSAPAPTRSAGPRAPSRRAALPGDVRPVRDRVMVKRIETGEEKVAGIIIPDSAKEKPLEARVVAAGSGRVLKNGSTVPLAVKAGDRVLIGKWAGTEVKIAGEEYLILKEDEVLGILH